MEAGRAFASDTARRMTVRYSPRIARWVAEREGVALADDGSLTLEHPVADESWAVRHVLQYGPDAEVVTPPSIRELLRERLSGASRPAR
jgi:predicted DNA-binding transcriptional regulator YafY